MFEKRHSVNIINYWQLVILNVDKVPRIWPSQGFLLILCRIFYLANIKSLNRFNTNCHVQIKRKYLHVFTLELKLE